MEDVSGNSEASKHGRMDGMRQFLEWIQESVRDQEQIIPQPSTSRSMMHYPVGVTALYYLAL